MLAAILSGASLARAHWKLIGLGLLCLAVAVQSVRLGHRSNQLERAKIANNELRAELKAISDAKNRQAEETRRLMEQAERNERTDKAIADRIRSAPIVPGKCETPGLDILRNEI